MPVRKKARFMPVREKVHFIEREKARFMPVREKRLASCQRERKGSLHASEREKAHFMPGREKAECSVEHSSVLMRATRAAL